MPLARCYFVARRVLLESRILVSPYFRKYDASRFIKRAFAVDLNTVFGRIQFVRYRSVVHGDFVKTGLRRVNRHMVQPCPTKRLPAVTDCFGQQIRPSGRWNDLFDVLRILAPSAFYVFNTSE
ncbi:hypothetical protein AV654_05635 [Paenibacillus elgii]|uniref:Uncharacterized protein n=1 Tax=Paenibacillus elgii TaxID=189691 RepID=A0A165PM70_9BACL|nr:hypothetical protein AV654_05635 [Paenibacillus elgii]